MTANSDTTGWNFYQDDQSLQDLLSVYLKPDLLGHLTPHLYRLGEMVANELDAAARLANSHTPVLHHQDGAGRHRQWIEYHTSYLRLEEVAFNEFGIHAMAHKSGILGWPKPIPAVAKHAFTYLFNQADFGAGGSINITDSTAHIVSRFASPELKEKYLHLLLSQDMGELLQGGQYIMEKEGEAGIGPAIISAAWDGRHWRIFGRKWFCSNANAGVALVLARPDGAPAGAQGFRMFLMPHYLEDGASNNFRLVRLKDKLGTKSMASAEVDLEGAIAYPIGEAEDGYKHLAEMASVSRISNSVKSAALMRRAAHDARAVLLGRKIVGDELLEKPLVRRQMLKILLPTEQALSFCSFTVDAKDRVENSETQPACQAAASILRLATPLLKFRVSRDSRAVTGDALDMRSGFGYLEDKVNARLVRDAYIGSVWEGSGNIVAWDTIRRAISKYACQEAFQADLISKLDNTVGVPPSFIADVKVHLYKSVAFAEKVAGDPAYEGAIRQATSNLYHAGSAALMTWEASKINEIRGDGRRILWARLVIDHRLKASDPYHATTGYWEETVSRILLGDEAIPLEALQELITHRA